MEQNTAEHIAQFTQFGSWLKDQRVGMGLSLREAGLRSGLTIGRLSSIESGTIEVGINNLEVSLLCRTYKIPENEFTLRANNGH